MLPCVASPTRRSRFLQLVFNYFEELRGRVMVSHTCRFSDFNELYVIRPRTTHAPLAELPE